MSAGRRRDRIVARPQPAPRRRAWSTKSFDDAAADRVARLRAGDPQAFDAIYREFVDPLRGFAYRHVRSREAAVEIVQDVFLAVWRNREQLSVGERLRAYLYGATRNRSLDWLERESVRRRWYDDPTAHGDGDAHAPPADAASDGEWAEILHAVVQAIEAMPERRRVVCSLRWRSGMSLAEIATTLGISQKTVETQLSRGLKQLREQFRPG